MADETRLPRYDLLNDPLIRQVMKADGVSPAELAGLMAEVSARLKLSGTGSPQDGGRMRRSPAFR